MENEKKHVEKIMKKVDIMTNKYESTIDKLNQEILILKSKK